MWRKIPLSGKLIFSLLLVQASALAIGATWLIHWNSVTRMKDLNQRLDTESDVIEDTVQSKEGKIFFSRSGEASRELDREPDIFFALFDANNKLADASNGPPAEVRQELQKKFETSKINTKHPTLVSINGSSWLVQSEPVEHSVGDVPSKSFVFVALKAQPILDQISQFEQTIVVVALGILLIASLGTGLVVTYSTRNLRTFAKQLRTVQPPRFDTGTKLVPQSAEEGLLFDGYEVMVKTVKKSIENQNLFIAHASHELKTPIAAAIAATEVALSRPRSAPEYMETHQDVLGELKVLKRLSAALLDLARVDETASSTGTRHHCTLNDVVSLVFDRWERPALEKGIALEFEKSKHLGLNLSGSRDQWEIVIGNLVDNAIKYGSHGGRVIVSAKSKDNDQIEISIVDNGIGMAPDEVAHLGEVFFRADAARSENGSFGLGFAFAQRIAKRLGGEIRVESALEKGTTISIAARTIT